MNLINLINLLNVPKIGQQRIRLLISQLGSKVNPFNLSIQELCKVKGIDKRSATEIKSYSNFEYGITEFDGALEKGIKIISFWSNGCPCSPRAPNPCRGNGFLMILGATLAPKRRKSLILVKCLNFH